jgi:hypothetical protein
MSLAEEFFSYQYVINIDFFTEGEGAVRFPAIKIISAIKKCDYARKFMPYWTVELVVGKSDLFQMRELTSELLAVIEVKSIKYATMAETINDGMSSSAGDLESKEIYVPIFDDNTFTGNYEEHKYTQDDRVVNMLGESDNPMETGDVNIIVHFVNNTAIKITKLLFNAVYHTASVGTGIVKILSKANVPFIVDPPSNDTAYANLLLLPHDFKASLLSLQSRYGIYDRSIMLFYDDNVIYLLSKYAFDHEHIEGENTISTLVLTEPLDDLDPLVYISEDGDGKVIYKMSGNLDPITHDIEVSETSGDAVIFSNYGMALDVIDYKDGEILADREVPFTPPARMMVRDIDSHTKTGQKIVIDYDDLNNIYNMTSIFTELDALNNMFEFVIPMCYIRSFKPNRFIEVVMENKEKNARFGKKYNVMGVIFTFGQTRPELQNMICSAKVQMCAPPPLPPSD